MPNSMPNQSLSDTAIATIAAGYASRSDVSIDDILTLVARLQGATAPAETQTAPATIARQTPAMQVDQAMTEDTIFCLCCGKGFKMLKRHIGAEHGLNEAEYRAMFGLPADAPLVAPSYSKRKAEHAKESGLGRYEREASAKSTEIS